ncbi:probable inactive poly [ADP-ribose] polymerase SRO5 [Rhodamnia argentea]|uniref:Probable inactive poly [ADP-ribose] polymerase SRO5 n=1 Tax=Rhodamnia argentea TaxID=178133 RepID=A0ABM3HJ34_9MYRT|nr:probable inactive poly [ADP-ribose] polymerase SRO5 [Rhodamnia argentea]
MANYTHQRQSPTVRTATPNAAAREFNRPAIDLNRPAQDDRMDNQGPNSYFSDCKSNVPVGQSGTPPILFTGGGLLEHNEGDKVHHLIKERFVSSLAAVGVQVTFVAVHKNCYSGVSAKGRVEAFQVYSRAVRMKGGANTANMKYAWYATSKEEISKILSYGFGYSGKPENNDLHGRGVYFTPYGYPLESVKSAPIDEDGLRHLLLCRVLLGKTELVGPGSEQSHPSSEQYDSGIDNLSSARRYIIWSTHLNTHVLPEYIVSFRAPCCLRGFLTTPEKSLKSTVPWIPFPIMISELSKILPSSDVNSISKFHKDYEDMKIPRHELIQKFRQIAGDGLLSGIFKNFKNKPVHLCTRYDTSLCYLGYEVFVCGILFVISAVGTTPDAVAREVNHPAIDLNRPAPDDPMNDQDPNSSISDCESVVSADQSVTPPLLVIGGVLMELSEGDYVHHLIKEHSVSRLAMLGVQVTLVTIQGNCYFDVSAKARAEAFQVYSQAV